MDPELGNTPRFAGKLALQQRVLPEYRAPFFDALAEACEGGLSVFAGQPGREESITPAQRLAKAAYTPARNWRCVPASSPLYVCWQGGLLRWLESCQPDVLVVEANPRTLSTRLAIRWMHTRRRPVIGWGLGAPGAESASNSLSGSVMERLSFLKSLDGMVAYSQRGAAQYRQLGIPADCIVVAPNAVTRRPERAPAPRPAQFAGRPCVLFVGRLQARKRVDNLLRACARLPDRLQPRLVIVGDGPALEELKALALAVYPPAEFPGARRGLELEPYFDVADLFVLPGTGGLAVQQAMSHGLPVIVAEGDGTQDDLVRPGSGINILANDENALRQSLETVLSDPPSLRQMGVEAFRIVAEEVNLEKMVEAFVSLLNKLVAKS